MMMWVVGHCIPYKFLEALDINDADAAQSTAEHKFKIHLDAESAIVDGSDWYLGPRKFWTVDYYKAGAECVW